MSDKRQPQKPKSSGKQAEHEDIFDLSDEPNPPNQKQLDKALQELRARPQPWIGDFGDQIPTLVPDPTGHIPATPVGSVELTPLTEPEQAVLEIIVAQPKGQAITGKEIITALRQRDPPIEMSLGTPARAREPFRINGRTIAFRPNPPRARHYPARALLLAMISNGTAARGLLVAGRAGI